MTMVELVITECMCVRSCISVCNSTFVPLFFFFRFNKIKTWVVSLYYRGVLGYNFPLQNIAFISLKISQCRH